MKYKLSDQIISEIAKLLQMAIITGTDIVDNLRTIEVEMSDDMLVLTNDYINTSTNNINKLEKEAERLSQDCQAGA